MDKLRKENLNSPSSASTVSPAGFALDVMVCFRAAKAIEFAEHGAIGDGPPTWTHRNRVLADRLADLVEAELPGARASLPASLFPILQRVVNTVRQLISEARVALPGPDDPHGKRSDNPVYKAARTSAHFCREEWEAGLQQNPILKHSLAALATSSAQWPLLGFADEDEFKEHMDPTVRGLSRSTAPMQRDLFERFLTRPEFTTAELIEEGYRGGLMLDTVNALLWQKWAVWTGGNPGAPDCRGTLTPVGLRLLRKLLDESSLAPNSSRQKSQQTNEEIVATPENPKPVFVSYSHKDKKLFEEFKTMLAPAIRDGLVDIWDDKRIEPGAKWRDEIQAALISAKVAVLLVSQHFLASPFIAKHELDPLLKAAQDKGVTIFWIYFSPCLYEHTEIATYQAAHDVVRPLDQLNKPQRQAALSEICAKLIRLARNS
jgi:TIR domain